MTAETVSIPTPHGDVTLPLAQARTMVACVRRLRATVGTATWHRNDCGCCVTVHEDAEHVTAGYLIGPDGGVDWLDEADDA